MYFSVSWFRHTKIGSFESQCFNSTETTLPSSLGGISQIQQVFALTNELERV